MNETKKAKTTLAVAVLLLLVGGECDRRNTGPRIPREQALGSFIDYELNHFVRVIPEKGLNIRERPDMSSAVIMTIPFRTHFRLLGRSSQQTAISNHTGYWSYAQYYPLSPPSASEVPYSGWVFDGYTGPVDYPASAAVLSGFESGCIGVGCYVCGSKVFDPDGTFWDSVLCDAPVYKGRWWREDGIIQACISPDCAGTDASDITFSIEKGALAMTCNTNLCKQAHQSPERFKNIFYWEPHGFGKK